MLAIVHWVSAIRPSVPVTRLSHTSDAYKASRFAALLVIAEPATAHAPEHMRPHPVALRPPNPPVLPLAFGSPRNLVLLWLSTRRHGRHRSTHPAVSAAPALVQGPPNELLL